MLYTIHLIELNYFISLFTFNKCSIFFDEISWIYCSTTRQNSSTRQTQLQFKLINFLSSITCWEWNPRNFVNKKMKFHPSRDVFLVSQKCFQTFFRSPAFHEILSTIDNFHLKPNNSSFILKRTNSSEKWLSSKITWVVYQHCQCPLNISPPFSSSKIDSLSSRFALFIFILWDSKSWNKKVSGEEIFEGTAKGGYHEKMLCRNGFIRNGTFFSMKNELKYWHSSCWMGGQKTLKD